jgi:folate-binding protein YgfZ
VVTSNAYGAAHERAAFRRRHERGLLQVTGPDRLDWLQGLLTNDVKALSAGGTCYAAWLTPHGRMVTDMTVVETGQATWLDVPEPLAASLAAKLDLLIFTEDVRVVHEPGVTSVGVYGPASAGALRSALDDRGVSRGDLEAVSPSGALLVGEQTPLAAVVADPSLGVSGYRIYLSGDRAAGLEEALARGGVPPLDDQVEKALRIEAGTPRFLADMNDETIPLEAGLDHALSHTKGCYVGQEMIVRIRDRGHGRVARTLVGLELAGGTAVPAEGQTVTVDGRPVGSVTSAALSPGRGRPVALAMLHRDAARTGTAVGLEDGTAAVVTALPIGRES